jgi:hypothetical protein
MSDWRTRKGANLEKPSFDDECRIPASLDRGVSTSMKMVVCTINSFDQDVTMVAGLMPPAITVIRPQGYLKDGKAQKFERNMI